MEHGMTILFWKDGVEQFDLEQRFEGDDVVVVPSLGECIRSKLLELYKVTHIEHIYGIDSTWTYVKAEREYGYS